MAEIPDAVVRYGGRFFPGQRKYSYQGRAAERAPAHPAWPDHQDSGGEFAGADRSNIRLEPGDQPGANSRLCGNDRCFCAAKWGWFRIAVRGTSRIHPAHWTNETVIVFGRHRSALVAAEWQDSACRYTANMPERLVDLSGVAAIRLRGAEDQPTLP